MRKLKRKTTKPHRFTGIPIAGWALAGVLSLALGGCAQKSVRAAAPVSAAPVPTSADRPMNTAPDTDATPPVESASQPPTLPATATAPPQPVASSAAKPVPPRKPSTEQPAADAGTEAPHRPAPQIAPQLSASDQAAYERKTNDDISLAEKNLQQTTGKQLSAAQQDLTEKIRSFLGQSREAGKEGDWTRAQNLAQKARLLSIELVNTL
jgi:hypothetical protein